MKTKDLIDALAREETPPPKRRPWTAAAALGLVGGVLLLLLFIGPRPDLGSAMGVTLAKAAFSACFAAAGLALVVRLAKPGRPGRARMLFVAGLIIVSLIAAAIALMGENPGQRMRAWTGGDVPWCLVFIPLLALPAALALGYVVKQFAPTHLTLTGAGIGAAAGGIGAMAYALHCPVDTMPFVATWYALAIALSAVIGAIFGARFLRW